MPENQASFLRAFPENRKQAAKNRCGGAEKGQAMAADFWVWASLTVKISSARRKKRNSALFPPAGLPARRVCRAWGAAYERQQGRLRGLWRRISPQSPKSSFGGFAAASAIKDPGGVF